MKKPQSLTTQANDLAREAHTLLVTTPAQVATATEFLSRANKTLDALEAQETERTYRLKEQLKLEQAPFIVPKKTLKEIILTLRTKLGAYQTQAAQAAAIEANKIADRASKGSLKMTTAVKKLSEIDRPEDKVVVDSGSLTFRPKETLKITNIEAIPRGYLVPDEAAILTTLKTGKTIPGCEICVVQVPINRR